MKDPNSAACIRLVRVRICDPAVTDKCDLTAYRAMFPLVKLPLELPMSTTIAAVETLGAAPGDEPCP